MPVLKIRGREKPDTFSVWLELNQQKLNFTVKIRQFREKLMVNV